MAPHILNFNIVQILVCGYAWWRGGQPERVVALLLMAPLAPTHSAHDAMLAFLLSFLLLHTLLALVLSVLQALRVRRGYVGMKAPYEPVVVSSFWSFTAGAAAVGWLAFALLPLAFAR